MSKRTLLILCMILPLAGWAQTYSFESHYTNWSAQQGTLSLSTDHYKAGTHSLCWETKGSKSVMLVRDFTQYQTGTGNSCFMQIYLPEATGDTLQVEFLNGSSAKRVAKMVCNYEGWREFNRAYTEYSNTANATITALRFTLIPTDNTVTRRIYIDDVNLNMTTDAGRVPGTQWVCDEAYFKVNTTPLRLYANPRDIATTEPTEQELSDLEIIRSRVLAEPGYNAPQALVAKNWVQTNISVLRDENGKLLHGTIIGTRASDLTEANLVEIGTRLQTLAGGKINGSNAAVVQAFDDYLDLLLDQGLAEGANIAFASNSYSAPRNVIPLYVSILPACNDEQRDKVARLIAWMSFYYMAYYPEDVYLAGNVSDVLYLFLLHMEAAAAARPLAADAVRELRAIQRFLNRNAEYVPGGGDMLKPDGTGFHHNTHYNNYMYAYQTYATGIYNFRNTCFEVSEQTYDHFGKAVLSVYSMATGGTADTRFFANSLCGRNPFDAGVKLAFNKSLFRQLIESGDSYPELQNYYKGAFNYFYQTNDYEVDAVSLEGCHSYNYSPALVVRQGKWVATMRAPTSKFWGAEIYSKENRFGRYQSHGSLDIMYEGSTLATSGYPTNKNGGGWDWNVIPGTTTVHYTSWAEMMPKQSQTQRFDQYSGGTNYSGAVADGVYGVFSTNLSQIDKWGSNSCYTPTNLKAHKSVFVFDSVLVAIGSDISSQGSYSDDMITATNLFQNIVSPSVGKLVVNGVEISDTYQELLPRSTYNWLLNPSGTGYYLPTNNQQIEVIYGPQTTPVETGADYTSPTTTLTAAKAYIHHGVKCSSSKYEFAVVPATNKEKMQDMAARMEAGTVYRVLQQDDKLHAVQADNVIGYSFFTEASGMTYGIVRSTTHQHLLLDRVLDHGNEHVLTVCNPNLEPKADALFGWVASETQTTLTLEGEWMLRHPVENVLIETPAGGNTLVTITFLEGEARQLQLIPYDPNYQQGTAQGHPTIGASAHKSIKNGVLYIERGGAFYTMMGSKL